MKRHRIAYLCGSDSWGGLEMNQLRNALWMKNRGHEVVVLGWKGSKFIEEAKKQGLTIHIVPSHKKYYPLLSAIKLAFWLNKNDFPNLIVRAYTDLSLASGTAFFGGRKLKVYYFMEMNLGGGKKQFFRTIRFNRLAAWCCPLDVLKQQVIANTNFNLEKIHVIPSGVDFTNVINEPKELSRKKLNLPEKYFLFGLVGRIDPQKGQLLAVKALARISDEKVKLVIVGEKTKGEASDYEQELNEFIYSKNLQDRVLFLPFQENPFVVFNAFDWTLMTSLAETVGMVTIESMAQGTPVIGSNSGGTTEILNYGKAGLLFEPNNDVDLAEKMKTAISGIQFETKNTVTNFNHKLVCKKVEDLL